MLALISDWDTLLGSNINYLLGTWLDAATAFGSTEDEVKTVAKSLILALSIHRVFSCRFCYWNTTRGIRSRCGVSQAVMCIPLYSVLLLPRYSPIR